MALTAQHEFNLRLVPTVVSYDVTWGPDDVVIGSVRTTGDDTPWTVRCRWSGSWVGGIDGPYSLDEALRIIGQSWQAFVEDVGLDEALHMLTEGERAKAIRALYWERKRLSGSVRYSHDDQAALEQVREVTEEFERRRQHWTRVPG